MTSRSSPGSLRRPPGDLPGPQDAPRAPQDGQERPQSRPEAISEWLAATWDQPGSQEPSGGLQEKWPPRNSILDPPGDDFGGRGRFIWRFPGSIFERFLGLIQPLCNKAKEDKNRARACRSFTQAHAGIKHGKNMPIVYPSARRHPNEGLQREAGPEKRGSAVCACGALQYNPKP